MTSTAISSLSVYNAPFLTEPCGEVYCSLTHDCFVINCLSCSEEFNLLSCNLFMKHVKECLPAALHELVLQTPQSLATDDMVSECRMQENVEDVPVDPLIAIKEEDVSSIQDEVGHDQSMDFEESFDTIKQERLTENEAEDNKSEVADENDEVSNPLSSRKENKVIISLIEEYRKHPCLWNNEYKAIGGFQSYDAVKRIMRAINTKHDQNFTKTQIRTKLLHLRSSYTRAVRSLEAYEKKHPNKKAKPRLWYFDRISFIENETVRDEEGQSQKCDEPKVVIENKALSEEEILSDIEAEVLHNLEELSSEAKEGKNNSCMSSRTCITRSKPLLKAVVDEYKKRPSVWHERSSSTTRKKDLSDICFAINEKFNTNIRCRSLDGEMSAVISLYRKSFRRGDSEPHEESKQEVWLIDLLSFINSEDSESNGSYARQEERIHSPTEETSIERNSSDDEDEASQRARTMKNKVILLRIIELYKEATLLWDPSHPQHILRNVRKKHIKAITDKLREEHGCQLTIEDFLHQIRFLKSSYFRAVRNEVARKQEDSSRNTAFKPFFFDEMSFLRPYVTKSFLPPSDLEIKKEHQQDFKSLCENESLMLSFVELYKSHACLWDQSHKDRKDSSAHAVAYREIIDMFKQNGEDYTEDRVRAAISFLHSIAVNSQKMLDTKESVWFYEHVQFLKSLSRNKKKFCTHCNKQFRSLAAYEKHKIEIVGEYPYKCEICSEGFVTKSKYSYHQITHKQPHKCDQCDFQAFDKHNLEVHMRRHKGIYLFRCDECDKGFVTSSELNRHLRMHTGKKAYVCEICGKELAEKAGYLRHLKQHRNERNYKCKVCDSAFNTDKGLECHMVVHSTERTHVCDTCGKAFKRKKTLLQHKALHMEEKKHECNICGKLFAQKAGVYSHMKSHGQAIGS